MIQLDSESPTKHFNTLRRLRIRIGGTGRWVMFGIYTVQCLHVR